MEQAMQAMGKEPKTADEMVKETFWSMAGPAAGGMRKSKLRMCEAGVHFELLCEKVMAPNEKGEVEEVWLVQPKIFQTHLPALKFSLVRTHLDEVPKDEDIINLAWAYYAGHIAQTAVLIDTLLQSLAVRYKDIADAMKARGVEKDEAFG